MTNSTPSPLRHAVVGVGAGIFSLHRHGLGLDSAQLVAVNDVNPQTGQARAEEYAVPFFADHREMLAQLRPDVTVIITPHPFHAPIAIDALNAGSHVLVEKPIAVQVAEADAMVAAAEANQRILAVNFQHRHRPEVRAVRQLIQSGGLGEIIRVTFVAPWLRTAAYFKAAGWRGTWRGEGGGVLMNQAPHDLDLICYLVGAPKQLYAWTRTVRHAIETEDTVTAMLEWENGAQGSLYFSTAEAGPRRLEIVGTAGKVLLDQGGATLERYETDLVEHIANNPGPFAAPALLPAELEMEPESDEPGHVSVYRDLHQAIRTGSAVRCDGRQARQSLELANAMIYSSHTNQAVQLPLERAAYGALLAKLCE